MMIPLNLVIECCHSNFCWKYTYCHFNFEVILLHWIGWYLHLWWLVYTLSLSFVKFHILNIVTSVSFIYGTFNGWYMYIVLLTRRSYCYIELDDIYNYDVSLYIIIEFVNSIYWTLLQMLGLYMALKMGNFKLLSFTSYF
jgi:hypothetical protein